jgi:hypothetical protein
MPKPVRETSTQFFRPDMDIRVINDIPSFLAASDWAIVGSDNNV